MIERMTLLVFQLGLIIFAARISGLIFERFRMPAIVGEITAGIIIGPYLLGGINIPVLGQPLFVMNANFPVSFELYGFTTVASIILLFLVGLETDLEMFIKYSLAGSLVGIGGVVVSFIFGNLTAVFLSRYLFGVYYGFSHPACLFLGVIATATSVGITARILSEKKKMQSPEGVTIISGAVIDDILGIIALAIVIGIARSGHFEWHKVTHIAIKSVLIWVGFTLTGILLSRHISLFLKRFKDTTTITIMGLGMALILAGIFEKAGLAMIIGAYVMGLSLSRTDLDYVIQEKLASLHRFFVPIFFCVMGMMVDLSTLKSSHVILFGLAYTVTSIIGKIIGCGLPALFLNFNTRGALRIGLGMTPRGEVTLLIASIGLTTGLLGQAALGSIIMMTIVTALIAPVMLSASLKSVKPVLRKSRPEKERTKNIQFEMPTPDTSELILSKIITAFGGEGFFVHRLDTDKREEKLFQIRKDQVFIVMRTSNTLIEFDCKDEDSVFINTLVYEVICDLENTMHQLQQLIDSRSMGKKIFTRQQNPISANNKMTGRIKPNAVKFNLQASDKKSIIEEMVELIIISGQLDRSKKEGVIKAIVEREETMSTGMQDGIAMPHAKTDAVNSIVCALGTKKEGVNFQSLDGEKSNIFIMILSPRNVTGPHIRFMADISQLLVDPDFRKQLIYAKDDKELFSVFTQSSIQKTSNFLRKIIH
jgi:Kef-type K+ transport system membrane component KefB/mannitol/fructose-specific phosphotransferase system IIA component (Ntr-type)